MVRIESRENDFEVLVLATAGKYQWVVSQRLRRSIAPTSSRYRFVNAIVVQLSPKKLLERFEPVESLENFEDLLLVSAVRHKSVSKA